MIFYTFIGNNIRLIKAYINRDKQMKEQKYKSINNL
jgi:hypothetical protein